MKPQNRRSIFKKMFAGFLGITGASVAANATPNSGVDENGKEVFNVQMDQDIPLFSGATKFAGMVFVARQKEILKGGLLRCFASTALLTVSIIIPVALINGRPRIMFTLP